MNQKSRIRAIKLIKVKIGSLKALNGLIFDRFKIKLNFNNPSLILLKYRKNNLFNKI